MNLKFPAGSAGGRDGLRPQHIRDMLLCRETGSEFLTALTSFVNMILACGTSFPWWPPPGVTQENWWCPSYSNWFHLAVLGL